MTTIVSVDCSQIADWGDLHDAFAEAFGFPAYYGRNANAWIDCMTNLDTDDSTIRVAPGEIVTLALVDAKGLKNRAPALLSDILELAAFVNHRRMDNGESPILCVSAQA